MMTAGEPTRGNPNPNDPNRKETPGRRPTDDPQNPGHRKEQEPYRDDPDRRPTGASMAADTPGSGQGNPADRDREQRERDRKRQEEEDKRRRERQQT